MGRTLWAFDVHRCILVKKVEALYASYVCKVCCKRLICAGPLGPSNANHLSHVLFHPITTLFSSPNINSPSLTLVSSPSHMSATFASPANSQPRLSLGFCCSQIALALSLILSPHSHSRLSPSSLAKPCDRLAISANSQHSHSHTHHTLILQAQVVVLVFAAPWEQRYVLYFLLFFWFTLI